MQRHADISSTSNVVPASESAILSPKQIIKQDAVEDMLYQLPIQRKLAVGATDDPMEHKADAMADKVMRMPEQNFIHRKCAHRREKEKETVQRKPLASFIQRKGDAGNNSRRVGGQ